MAMNDVYFILPNESSQVHHGFEIEPTFTWKNMCFDVAFLADFRNLQMRVSKIIKNPDHRPAQLAFLQLSGELYQNILPSKISTATNQL